MASLPAKYTGEFRRETADYIISTGRPITECCAELGLDSKTVNKWVQDRRRELSGGPGPKAEDRELFKETMAAIGEPTIPSGIANTVAEALAVADRIGYPVIIRPAFTLGGTGGGIVDNREELMEVAANGLALSPITQTMVRGPASAFVRSALPRANSASREARVFAQFAFTSSTSATQPGQ